MRTRVGRLGIEPKYDPRTDIAAGVRPLENKTLLIVIRKKKTNSGLCVYMNDGQRKTLCDIKYHL